MVRADETFALPSRKQFSNACYSKACILSLGQDRINSAIPLCWILSGLCEVQRPSEVQLPSTGISCNTINVID